MSKTKIAVCCCILIIILCAGAVLNDRIAQRRDAHQVHTLRTQSANPQGTTFMPREYIRVVRYRDLQEDRSSGRNGPSVMSSISLTVRP